MTELVQLGEEASGDLERPEVEEEAGGGLVLNFLLPGPPGAAAAAAGRRLVPLEARVEAPEDRHRSRKT